MTRGTRASVDNTTNREHPCPIPCRPVAPLRCGGAQRNARAVTRRTVRNLELLCCACSVFDVVPLCYVFVVRSKVTRFCFRLLHGRAFVSCGIVVVGSYPKLSFLLYCIGFTVLTVTQRTCYQHTDTRLPTWIPLDSAFIEFVTFSLLCDKINPGNRSVLPTFY